EIEERIRDLPTTELIHVQNGQGYDYTYTIATIGRSLPRPLARQLSTFALRLVDIDPGDSIIFFTGLLDDKISGASVHFLFAALRDWFVRRTNSAWSAVHAPLSTVGANVAGFPLHCDMYIPEILWNVFDEVPSDTSGASTFLPVNRLLALLEGMPSISA